TREFPEVGAPRGAGNRPRAPLPRISLCTGHTKNLRLAPDHAARRSGFSRGRLSYAGVGGAGGARGFARGAGKEAPAVVSVVAAIGRLTSFSSISSTGSNEVNDRSLPSLACWQFDVLL